MDIWASDGSKGDWADYVRPPLNHAELRTCFEKDFHKRDFWEDHFNKDILQQILDEKFNPKPGSIYVAQKDHFQLKIRLQVYCKVCQCDLKSYDVFMGHNDGMGHKKMQKCDFNPEASMKVESHFRSLAEVRDIFQPGQLEHMIDHCTQPIVGVSFLHCEELHKRGKFVCRLCTPGSFNTERMFAHIKSSAHAKNYFKVKFQREVPEEHLEKVCYKIMEIEGRINHMIMCDQEIKSLLLGEERILSPTENSLKRNSEQWESWKAEPRLNLNFGKVRDSVEELSKFYVHEVYEDKNKWSLILQCMFIFSKVVQEYITSKPDPEGAEHCQRLYHYLSEIYEYDMCVIMEN